MATVRMLRGTVGPDGTGFEAGAVVDVPPALAAVWCRTGRAAPVDGVPLDEGTVMVVQRDPSPATPDRPASRRRGGA